MTAELVPLRTGFDLAWLGFRRDQVWHYVHEAERDIELLTADRDAAEAGTIALEDRAWEFARRTHAAHRELLAATRERMARIVRGWDHRHRALDEAAAHHRAQVTEDFELALAPRRKEACHDVWLMEETTRRRADQVVQEATRQAEVLLEHRDRVADVLRVAHALLGKATVHL